MADFEFAAKVTVEEVITALSYLRHDDLVHFLGELDDTIGDWDFTQKAYEYFHDEMGKLGKNG